LFYIVGYNELSGGISNFENEMFFSSNTKLCEEAVMEQWMECFFRLE